MKKTALIGAILAAAAAVGCFIYGMVYEQYADFVTVVSLLLGGAFLAIYALCDKWTYFVGLLGVAATAFGAGLFLTNSYNVWADTWGNLQQYGKIVGEFNFFNSQGGPIPAVILLSLCLIAMLLGVITCFSGKKQEAE